MLSQMTRAPSALIYLRMPEQRQFEFVLNKLSCHLEEAVVKGQQWLAVY